MIVEDEMLVRMGLKNAIDWTRFGMCVVADVADGESALEIYEKEKPDLIITDLKMPGMSGMDLITRIREKDKTTKIVILTCMEEFDLVRQALQLGVSDYILKLTMTIDQIHVILSKMQQELSSDESRQPSLPKISDANRHVIKEKIMKDYILCNGYSEREFEALVAQYDFHLESERMIMCVLEMDHFAKIKKLFKDTNGQLVKHTMLNVLDEMFVNFRNGEAFCDDGAKYILIFCYNKMTEERIIREEVLQMLKEIETPFKTYFNATVSFGVSEIRSGYASLRSMYDQALNALEDKFFGGTGIYGRFVDFDRRTVTNEKTEEILNMCERVPGMAPAFLQEYGDRFRSIMREPSHFRAEVLEKFCHLVQWTVNSLKFQEEGSEQVILAVIQSIRQSETLDEIHRSLYDFLSRIAAAKRKRKVVSKEVRLALDYMETHYSSDLSLQQASAHVNLSPSYLSSLFKKEMNINFVDYLNEIRIEKAKELLLDSYLKSYEIAESVGFKENTYFCKIFKKVTGMTTGEYRKQWLVEQAEEPESEIIDQ